MSAAVAGPPTIPSSCFPAWVSPKLAVAPTDPPTWAIIARDKVQLQARNLDPPVSTPTNIDVLAKELSGHPDGNFLGNLLSSLCCCTPVGYLGPCKPQVSHNLQSAAQCPDVVSSNLTKESRLGRVAGPFRYLPLPNLQCHPVGVIPKKQSNEWCTIYHLSHPESDSVNCHILKDPYTLKYVRVDDAICILKSFGTRVVYGRNKP